MLYGYYIYSRLPLQDLYFAYPNVTILEKYAATSEKSAVGRVAHPDAGSLRRFLAYMAALKEIPRKTVAAEIARVAAAVNLTAELDKRLSAYSGGMKQRLLLASALLGDPKLLILDEPTAGLDPKERVRLRELLADMAKDRIILVATHVVSDVETVATKVILLRAGKIVDAAPVPELIAKYAPDQGLEDVYLNVFGEGDGK